MTSVLNVDTIADKAGTGPVGLTKQSAAKAWFTDETLASSSNFAEDSFNLSSTSDISTGQLGVSFTNIFNNDGYSAVGANHQSVNDVVGTKFSPNTTSQTAFFNYEPGNEVYKDAAIGGILNGDLA